MNPTYTSAEPVSLSATMVSIGTRMMNAARNRSPNFRMLKFGLLIVIASSSEVVILDISAGWNFTGPNSNHECEPFTSLDTKMTSTSRPRTMKYEGVASTSHSFGLMANSLRMAIRNAVIIQMNCLPLRKPQSKMEDGSAEWMDA